jgi:Restriction endonuclease fold toxin 7
MAANINIGAQRHEPSLPGDAEELTPPANQEEASSRPEVSEQSGNSAGEQSSDGSPPSTPAAPLPEESAPAPAPINTLRYGVGDTVILGAPRYASAVAFAANGIEEISDPIETPIDPAPPPSPPPPPPSDPLPPTPTPVDSLPPNPDPVDVTPAPTPTPTDPVPVPAGGGNPTPSPEGTTEPTTPPVVVMPKPGGSGTPTPTPEPQEPPVPTTNAPAIGGSPATVPVVPATPTPPANGVSPTAPTASAAELDAIDTMLADPVNAELIALARRTMGPAPTNSWVAEAQVKRYGEARFQEIMYLHRALPEVRRCYGEALSQAYFAQLGPESFDELGNLLPGAGSNFDINAFNTEYASRGDLMARAFADKFAGVPVTFEAGAHGVTSGDGAEPGLFMPVFRVGGLFSVKIVPQRNFDQSESGGNLPTTYSPAIDMYSQQQYTLGPDIGDHAALIDDTAVWFDPSMGFMTDMQNIKPDEDSDFDRVFEFVVQAGITTMFVFVGSGVLFGQGIAPTLTTPGAAPGIFANSMFGFSSSSWQYAALRGAALGGIGTVVNSGVTGRTLTLGDVARSMFTGGVMGGLVNYARLDTYGIAAGANGPQVVNWGERLTAILGRSAMQGLLQQVTGGRFRDGLVNGLTAELSSELTRSLNAQINEWAQTNQVSPFIASQLRLIAQGFSSALVQTAANGGQAGLEAFLNDLINGSIGATGNAERAEIEEQIVWLRQALDAEDYGTQARILDGLTRRWMNNHPGTTYDEALARVTDELGITVDTNHLVRDANGRLTAGGGTVITPAFDDDGYLMPGVVDPNASLEEQQAQLESYLRRNGYSASESFEIAANHFSPQPQMTAEQAADFEVFNEQFLEQKSPPLLVAGAATGLIEDPRALINELQNQYDSGQLKGQQDYVNAIGRLHEAFLYLKDGYTQTGDRGIDDANATKLITMIGDLGRQALDNGIVLPPDTLATIQGANAFEFGRAYFAMMGTGVLAGIRRVYGAMASSPSVTGRIKELNELIRSGRLTADELAAAQKEIKEIRGEQLRLNNARGTEFENATLTIEKLDKNTIKYTVTLSNGTVITVIPDVVTAKRIVEIKNVVDLSYSRQLDGIIRIGKPVDIIVSPRTVNISEELWNRVTRSGGNFYRLDPATGIKTPLTQRPTR